MKSEKGLLIGTLSMMGVGLVLMTGIHLFQDFDFQQEAELANRIGEIHHSNEQLSSATRFEILTRDPKYQQSYVETLERLDRVILETRAAAPTDAIRRAVESTYESHKRLVATDLRAMDLCRTQACEQAIALLDSKDYKLSKLSYVQGMQQALDAFEANLEARGNLARQLQLGLQLLLILSLGMTLLGWRQVRQSRMHALQVTIRTVMDVVNNNLNRMQLLQLRWKKQTSLSPEDFQELRELMRETSAKLKLMGDMQKFETLGEGPAELLRWQTSLKASLAARDSGK